LNFHHGKIITALLIIAYLVLAVGSVWHIHHGHDDDCDPCLWCLASLSVLILAMVCSLPRLAEMPGEYLVNHSDSLLRTERAHIWASRAPPSS